MLHIKSQSKRPESKMPRSLLIEVGALLVPFTGPYVSIEQRITEMNPESRSALIAMICLENPTPYEWHEILKFTNARNHAYATAFGEQFYTSNAERIVISILRLPELKSEYDHLRELCVDTIRAHESRSPNAYLFRPANAIAEDLRLFFNQRKEWVLPRYDLVAQADIFFRTLQREVQIVLEERP